MRIWGFQRPFSASHSIITPFSKASGWGSKWGTLKPRISQVPELRIASFEEAPEPRRANWVSCPEATTGIPGGREVSLAALGVTSPIGSPGSTQGGKKSLSTPIKERSSSDQSFF